MGPPQTSIKYPQCHHPTNNGPLVLSDLHCLKISHVHVEEKSTISWTRLAELLYPRTDLKHELWGSTGTAAQFVKNIHFPILVMTKKKIWTQNTKCSKWPDKLNPKLSFQNGREMSSVNIKRHNASKVSWRHWPIRKLVCSLHAVWGLSW